MPSAPAGRAFDSAHWYTARGPSDDRIETSGLVDKVVRKIGQDIISGQFKPGDTLAKQIGALRAAGRQPQRPARGRAGAGQQGVAPKEIAPGHAGVSFRTSGVSSIRRCSVGSAPSSLPTASCASCSVCGARSSLRSPPSRPKSMSPADLAALEVCHRDMISAGEDADRFLSRTFAFTGSSCARWKTRSCRRSVTSSCRHWKSI